MTEHPAVVWRKSSRSASKANCVEVAADGPVVAVRDSKSPGTGLLVFPARHWARFLASLRRRGPSASQSQVNGPLAQSG